VTPNEDGTNWITELCDRKNYIVRRSTNLSYASHILAANVDMAALIVTINHPITSTTFIDRFLATCEAYRVPACLIFNKIDLLSEAEIQELASLRQLYESLGYSTYAISALNLNKTELLSIFRGRVTLLSGNSGVGKSTLLNAIFGKNLARTGVISSAHHKGMHTTTFSEMYPLDESSWIIDTPGIKGFGMLDMERGEMGHYFREIFQISSECRYSDCVHINEPGCAVNQAVIDGRIAFSRYESYLSMLDDISENKYR
jgi:ribosome biogenesis GTPase